MPNETPAERGMRIAQSLNARIGSYKIIYPEAGTIKALKEEWWAHFMAEMRETALVFIPDEKSYFEYDPDRHIFVPAFKAALQLEMAQWIRFCAETWADPVTGASYDRELADFNNTKQTAGPLAYLEGVVSDARFFRSSQHLVHLADCSLRFSPGGELVAVETPHEGHRTKKRGPYKYDPKATCPRFIAMILGHLPVDCRILIQKYAGQCLLGRNLTQRFLCLVGLGRSGKGALVEVIRGIVGPDYVRELRTDHLQSRFEMGLFKDASLLIGPDVSGDFMVGPGANRIKSLTGHDLLTIELKNVRTATTMEGTFNIIINSNEEQLVNPQGDRRAWEGRILYIPYDQAFTGPKIPGLSRILLNEEGPGIINWALEGLALLLQDVKELGDFYRSPEQIQIVDELLAANDWFRAFIKKNVTMEKDSTLTTEEILSLYKDECLSLKRPIAPDRELHRRVRQIMEIQFGATPSENITRGDKRNRGYRGVRWKEAGE